MKKKNTSLIVSILSIAICIGCLTGFGITYSWIKRNWAPEFYATQMSVETGGSLAIKIAGDNTGKSYDKIDLTKDIFKKDNISLKQISNYTGKDEDFFSIDYSAGEGRETLKHLTPPSVTDSEKMIAFATEKGFVWARFQIQAQNDGDTSFTRYVFIDSYKSYIRLNGATENSGDTLDASESIRCSLSIEGLDSSTSGTTIFKKRVWQRDSDGNILYGSDGKPLQRLYNHYGAQVTADGENVYANVNKTSWNYATGCAVNTGNVYEFSDFNGGFPGYVDGVPVDEYTVDTSKTLFQIDFNSNRWIVFRLWLEGFDTNTVDDITGADIDFKLVFRAHEVQNTTT